MREALALYGQALSEQVTYEDRAGAVVRFEDGVLVPFRVRRYLSAADQLELRLLENVAGPVLDIGCGPGRHLRALTARGVPALGIDISPVAVGIACGNGARAIVADVFDDVPAAGSWRTALLLDGNIGIGGDPVRLLERLRSLLRPDGVALIELDPPGSTTCASRARVELGGQSSGWFAWARLAVGEVDDAATQAGMTTEREWSCGERWFAQLRVSV
jgi:SAM-dependent methyltransferase